MNGIASSRADSKRAAGLVAVALCAVLWSTGGLFIKIVPWDPIVISGTRSLIAGIVLLIYLRRPRFTWSAAQIFCALAYAATMISFVFSNKLTTAANAILLQYTAPVYAAFLGAILLGERTHWFDWATIAVVLLGMALFFMDKLSVGGMGGNILSVASGVFFAFAIVLLRKQKDGSPLESILLSHALTFLIALPFMIAQLPGALKAPGAPLAIGAASFLGIFQVGISSILLSYGVRHVSALQSMLTAIIEPILNPIWVFLLLGEKPSPMALVGGAIILAAVTARSVLTIAGSRGRPKPTGRRKDRPPRARLQAARNRPPTHRAASDA
jgi:drug/metabolite transporter (DMT)-like permease